MQRGWRDNYEELVVAGNFVPLLTSSPTNVPGLRFDDWHRFVSDDWICSGLIKLQDCSESDLREQLDHGAIVSLLRHAILSKSSRLVRDHLAFWTKFGADDKTCECLANAIDEFCKVWSPRHDYNPDERLENVIDLRNGKLEIQFSRGLTELCQILLSLKINDQTNFVGEAVPIELIGNGTESVEFPIVDINGEEKSFRHLNVDFSVGLSSSPSPSRSDDTIAAPDVIQQQWKAFLNGLPSFSLDNRDGKADKADQTNLLYLPSWFAGYTAGLDAKQIEFVSAGLAVAIQTIARGRKFPFGLGFSGEWQDKQLKPIQNLNRKMVAARNSGCVLFFACVHRDEWSSLAPPDGLRLVALPSGLEFSELLPMINFACGATGFTDFYTKCASGMIANPWIETHPNVGSASHDDRYPVGFVGREDDLKSLTKRLESGPAVTSAVVAPARVGKTSLLMKTVEITSPPPAWFKIDRTMPRTRYCDLLMSRLHQQLRDRYVPLRPSRDATGHEADYPNIFGPFSIVVDGMDEAASEKEATRIQEELASAFPSARILLGTQPNIVSNVTEIYPKSFPRFDDDWTATEHSIKDATELVERYQVRFKEKELSREASLVAQEGYARKAAERACGGIGHLTEFLESVCRHHETLPDDPESFPEFSDEQSYVNNLLERVLETYDNTERPRIELFTATLAFLRGRTWPITDVTGLAGLDDGSRFGEWTPTGLLSKGIGRILQCTPGHVRFYSPHTAQALRIHYQSEFPSIARSMLARLRYPNKDKLTASLVNNIAGLITEFGTPGLGDELLSTDWARMRFGSLIESTDSVRLLADELLQLPTLERADQAKMCCSWITQWQRDIDETSEVRSSWAQHDPSGFLSQSEVSVTGVPILFHPVVIPTGISLDAGDNSDVDGIHMRIDAAFQDGTICVCAAYVFDHIYPETTAHRHIALDGSVSPQGKRFWKYVADDGLECRLAGQSCILEARSTPTDDWSRIDLAALLGLTSRSEHNLNSPVVEFEELNWDAINNPSEMESDVDSQPVLEIRNAAITSATTIACSSVIQTGTQEQRCIVLVNLEGENTSQVKRVELSGEHGDLISGMHDLLVFEERREEDHYPVGDYVVDATNGDFFPENGTFPSLHLVSISRQQTLILVRATDEGCNGAYLHGSGTMPARYLADTTHLSRNTFVADVDNDRVVLVSVCNAEDSWTIQNSVLLLSEGIIIDQPPEDGPAKPITIKGWVRDCTITEKWIVIAFQSGRIEIRSKHYPYPIYALAFVTVSFDGEIENWVNVSDLLVSQISDGCWLWVATDQLNRFDLNDLISSEKV